MMKSTMVLVMCGMLAGLSQAALADGIDDCNSDCTKVYTRCITRAGEYVNDIEVQDAKAICESGNAACTAACMDKEQNRGFVKPPVAEKPDAGKKKGLNFEF